MKRLLAYLVGLVLVGAAVTAIALAAHSSKSQDENISSQSNTTPAVQTVQTVKKACSIFTLADAKKLLGDTAKGGGTTGSTSADLAVTSCVYTQDSGSNVPVSGDNSATLLVRAPKTAQGRISNQNQFGPLRPTGTVNVSGYGDKAYWDPQYGQLNILKNGNWYILSYGSITPSDRSLAQTQQLANLLISKM